MVAPRCFELSTFSNTRNGVTTRLTAQITLGGVVRKLLRAEQIAVYDIHLPGNEVEIVSDLNGVRWSRRMYASRANGVSLTIQKASNSSSLSVRIAGSDRDWITLKGPADLFSTLDLPETLPPLSSYSEALVLQDKVAEIGFCGPKPMVQYNDGKIRIDTAVPSGAASGAEPNSANAPVTGSGSKTATAPDRERRIGQWNRNPNI